jgi:hypothetical protein
LYHKLPWNASKVGAAIAGDRLFEEMWDAERAGLSDFS